jgi:hypothetical protein
MKTMHQIREALSKQFDDLPRKKTTPQIANAMCNITGKLITTVKLEMEATRLAGKQAGEHILKLMSGNGKVRR